MTRAAADADAAAATLIAAPRARPLEIVLVDVAAAADLLDAEERSMPRLSLADRARFASMSSSDDAARIWRAGRIATRIVLERWVGPGFRAVDLVVETGGRLRLSEPPPFFSVSHSGSMLLVAVAATGAVGVDLEYLRNLSMPMERRQRLRRASAALSDSADAEGDANAADRDDISDRAVLESWVRLEAAAKARGSGIGVLLTEAGVVGDRGARLTSGEMAFAVRLLQAGEGVVAAIAGYELPRALTVERFPTDARALRAFLRPLPQPQGR